MLERRFPRALGSLEAMFEFVAVFARAEGLDEAQAFETGLVLEELFTNQVKYNPASARELEVRLEREARNVILTLRDPDAEPFDPGRAPEIDVGRSLLERKPGGLGLHLVRRIARRIDYDYRDRCSTITVSLGAES